MDSVVSNPLNTTVSNPMPDTSVFFDARTAFLFDVFFNCFLIHFLSLLGIVGNLLNIVVLSRHNQKETTTIILISLSISDLCSSLFQPFRRLKCLVSHFDVPGSVTIGSFTFIFIYPITDYFETVSICHVTAIAIERFIAVCFPLHVSQIFTPHRVKLMILILYAYTFAMLFPLLLRLSYVEIFNETYNCTIGIVVESKLYVDNYDSFSFFFDVCVNNAFTTIPIVTIVICSCIISFKLSKRSSRFLKEKSKRLKERKVAKMLLTVCIVTVSANLPTAGMYLYSYVYVLRLDSIYIIWEAVIGNLYQFNASVNFLIYVTMSSKFAKTYKRLFHQ
ncbi:FMRFamide receptor-like [Physella acuta]|uniref:FMRFamide receptor-like n=1 Tax=Physella acuta TaxID=109671 RepID=UPI0027DD0A44|nr:FMRFamide receptor-like [Physella acuta]